MGYIADHLGRLLLLLALIGAAGILLRRALGRWGRPIAGDGPAVLFLGMAAWIAALFLLATVGALHRGVLLGLALVVAAGFGIVMARELRRSSPDWPERLPIPTGLTLLPTLALAITSAVLVVHALSPRISWDAAAYHLTVPRIWLDHGGFRPVPFHFFSSWPMNVGLLYALALTIRGHVLASLLHLAFGFLVVAVLHGFARRYAPPWTGLLAGMLFLMNPAVLLEMGEAYADVAFAFFLLLAFVFLVRAEEEPGSRRPLLLLAGIACGILAGVKLTGIAAVGCLLLGFPLARLKERLTFVLVPCALLLTPWLLRSWIEVGNPVFPFAFELFGGEHWSAALQRDFMSYMKSFGFGRSIVDYLLLPFRVLLEGGMEASRFQGRLSPLWIVLLPLGATFGWRHRAARSALIVSACYFAYWAVSSQQMRFLIPILPLLAIATALGLKTLVVEGLGGSRRTGALLLLQAGTAAFLLVAVFSTGRPAVDLLRSYLRYGDEILEWAEPGVFRFVRSQTPPDARILLVNTNQGFYCRREFIADSVFEAPQAATWMRQVGSVEGLRRLFREAGITHVLVWPIPTSIPYPPELALLLGDPSRAKLVYRAEDDPHLLYELLP